MLLYQVKHFKALDNPTSKIVENYKNTQEVVTNYFLV